MSTEYNITVLPNHLLTSVEEDSIRYNSILPDTIFLPTCLCLRKHLNRSRKAQGAQGLNLGTLLLGEQPGVGMREDSAEMENINIALTDAFLKVQFLMKVQDINVHPCHRQTANIQCTFDNEVRCKENAFTLATILGQHKTIQSTEEQIID